jgi:hypothetical protein
MCFLHLILKKKQFLYMTSHTTTVPTYKYLGLVVSEEKIFQVPVNQNLEKFSFVYTVKPVLCDLPREQ